MASSGPTSYPIKLLYVQASLFASMARQFTNVKSSEVNGEALLCMGALGTQTFTCQLKGPLDGAASPYKKAHSLYEILGCARYIFRITWKKLTQS